MIHVLETWHFKDEHLGDIAAVMQTMDELVGPAAHDHPAFSGHATFLRDEVNDPASVKVLYQWRSPEEADELIAGEDLVIAEFTQKYCTAPREVRYLTEVPHTHDMEDDHEHGHAHA
ncbi:hypothetical protein [Aeromicrobium sp. CF3.5]|uniref:hypothetical protein n=1 Tax=Aeromicrobium sp. CF3.5 TaxID=3373078 RepID=UPI003EE6C34B